MSSQVSSRVKSSQASSRSSLHNCCSICRRQRHVLLPVHENKGRPCTARPPPPTHTPPPAHTTNDHNTFKLRPPLKTPKPWQIHSKKGVYKQAVPAVSTSILYSSRQSIGIGANIVPRLISFTQQETNMPPWYLVSIYNILVQQ